MTTCRITYPTVQPGEQYPSFMGRNGYFHSTAVEVTAMSCGLIALQPITSRNRVARCVIELPDDPATLRALAQVLIDLAASAPQEAASVSTPPADAP